MRLALALCAIVLCACGQTSTLALSTKDMACVEDLSIPLYVGIPWIVRAESVITASIGIGIEGTPKNVEVSGSSKLLSDWVRVNMKNSRFSALCEGRKVQLAFDFKLVGTPSNTPINKVRFRAPGTFEIVATPPVSINEPVVVR